MKKTTKTKTNDFYYLIHSSSNCISVLWMYLTNENESSPGPRSGSEAPRQPFSLDSHALR